MTSARGIGALPDFLARNEGDGAVARVFALCDLPVEVAERPGQHLPLLDLIQLYEAAARITGDPLLGLRVGEAMIDDFGTWVDYARTAPTLRDCLQRASRTLRYHQTGTQLRLEENCGVARYSYLVPLSTPRGRAQHVEHTLPSLLATMRYYTGPGWRPHAIETDLPAGARQRRLEQALGVPLLTDKSALAVVFSAAELDCLPHPAMPSPKPVTNQALRALASGRPRQDLLNITRAMIETRLLSGRTDLDGLAMQMGMGSRTLQRRLAEERTGYRQLLSEVRAGMACQLLARTETAVSEIGAMLCYDDPAHFSRAFRLAFGKPPRIWRRDAQAGREG